MPIKLPNERGTKKWGKIIELDLAKSKIHNLGLYVGQRPN